MAMEEQHTFTGRVRWTGNLGAGTQSYKGYERTWVLSSTGKAPVNCSNDPRLGGDPGKLNPEELLVAALSSCHMLWYLHLASVAGIVVVEYEDEPVGMGSSQKDGSGQFISAVLRPRIKVLAGTDLDKAERLHGEIHKYCFIARSISFPVTYESRFEMVESTGET